MRIFVPDELKKNPQIQTWGVIRKRLVSLLIDKGYEFTNSSPSNDELAMAVALETNKKLPDKQSKNRAFVKKNAPILLGINRPQKRRENKKPSKSFYMSWEWKKLRFQVLQEYGSICMLCGSEEKIVVDHIKPRSKFPKLELKFDNLQVLCNDCNMGKSNDDYTDFRPTQESELPDEARQHMDDITKY